MIGLKRNTVQLAEHHSDWASLAMDACRTIQEACGDLLVDVQHVGSTAVPDLPAKPILDLVAAISMPEAMPELISRLTSLGYSDRGHRDDTGGHVFVVNSTPEIRTIHLHVVERDSRQWSDYLRFRDLLRQHPEMRQRYAALKKELAAIWPEDRHAYTAGKSGFIREALDSTLPSWL